MIKINKGEIILCSLDFSITPTLTPTDLERNMSNHIVCHDKMNTGYQNYNVWIDIYPSEYVYATVCFYENSLESIRIFPQYVEHTLPNKRPQTIDLVIARHLAEKWFKNHFSLDDIVFDWGTIHYFSGSDSIYIPPNVLFRYKK